MSSGFISEAELSERRRLRQQQWDQVRQPHQPQEAPEEEYDHRSLYDRLQAQKQKRDLEYEEAHRLKNMIKGLDDDEVEFLDLVDRSKLEEERRKCVEEAKEMAEFRREVATLHQESLTDRINHEIHRKPQTPTTLTDTRSTQSKLLAGAVVKKRCAPAMVQDQGQSHRDATTPPAAKRPVTAAASLPHPLTTKGLRVGSMRCVGVLPGLGHYRTEESSDELDSDESTDAEDSVVVSATSAAAAVASISTATSGSTATSTRFDLVGRKIVKKTGSAGTE